MAPKTTRTNDPRPKPPHGPARRAAIFLRVSKDEQTIENQRPDCEQLARVRGFEVVKLYEETASGAKLDRAQLAAMLADAHRGAFEVLVVWALDRLGRSMFETIATVQKLDRAHVEIVSVAEPWLDTGGPARSLLLAIFAWVAEQERGRMIERTIAGMARARREGKKIGRPETAIPMTLARSLRAEGFSVRAVARRLRVPPTTLRRALERAGVDTPPKASALLQEDNAAGAPTELRAEAGVTRPPRGRVTHRSP